MTVDAPTLPTTQKSTAPPQIVFLIPSPTNPIAKPMICINIRHLTSLLPDLRSVSLPCYYGSSDIAFESWCGQHPPLVHPTCSSPTQTHTFQDPQAKLHVPIPSRLLEPVVALIVANPEVQPHFVLEELAQADVAGGARPMDGGAAPPGPTRVKGHVTHVCVCVCVLTGSPDFRAMRCDMHAGGFVHGKCHAVFGIRTSPTFHARPPSG